MRRLAEVVATLTAGSDAVVIYAEQPWSSTSAAMLHDPWSAAGPPPTMAPLVDADLAHEYLRVWSSWQPAKPSPEASVEALLAFVARPLARSRVRVTTLPMLRATMQSGVSYDDPDEDLLYQLFLEMEGGRQRFIVLERLRDASGQTFVQAMREPSGTYVVEVRSGGPETHRAVVMDNMVMAFEAVSLWAFRGRDLPAGAGGGVAR